MTHSPGPGADSLPMQTRVAPHAVVESIVAEVVDLQLDCLGAGRQFDVDVDDARSASSIVVSSLKEVDSIIADQIDDAMFLRQTSRPSTRQSVLQRFRFSDSSKGIGHDRFDQVKGPQGDFSLGFAPESNRNSSRNSGWKTASRGGGGTAEDLFLPVKAHLLPQSRSRFHFPSTRFGTLHGSHQSSGILGRPQQVSRL